MSHSLNPLQPLHDLDRFSPEFHDRLLDILDGEEYKRSVSELEDEDLAQLVDDLDEVSCRTALARSLLIPA